LPCPAWPSRSRAAWARPGPWEASSAGCSKARARRRPHWARHAGHGAGPHSGAGRGRGAVPFERGARAGARAQRVRGRARAWHRGGGARDCRWHRARGPIDGDFGQGEPIMPTQELLMIAGGIVVGVIALLATIARMYRKVGPNQALIIYGVGGTRVVTGSGALVIPMFQSARELSLELMSFDVAPKKELYTNQGVAVLIDAVTQLKVRSDLENVKTPAEQFLDKSEDAREAAIRLVMEGHLRGIVGQLLLEQIVKEPEMVGDKVRSTCAADLAKMGLEMISFTIKEVRDQNEYIKNMGIPDIERIKKDANIAAAEAQRDTEIKRAMAMREAAVARAQADQERVIAETASQARQAEAQRDLEIKKAQYVESVQRQKAQADKAYEIQASVMQQQVVAEQVKIQQVERAEQVKVQESEIARRKNELIATELESANVESQKRQLLADGDKRRLA